jgi:hypothetical protein
VRIAASLAAALQGGIFEHPSGAYSSCPRRAGDQSSAMPKMIFPQSAHRMFTVAGHNNRDESDPNLSLSYDWGNAGKVIMSKPRPGTPEWRKQSRRGLAGKLATVVLRTL